MFKRYLLFLWKQASEQNIANVLGCLNREPQARLLDLGCGEGSFTLRLADRIGTGKIYGVEIMEKKALLAREKGIKVFSTDLNKPLPFENDFFDVIHSGYVIEHLFDVDVFVSEIFRILKPGGYTVVSTENLSSWHNIAALVLGRQAFSQHISERFNIGNIFSPHYKEKMRVEESRGHVKIFTYYGLKAIFQLYGFKVEGMMGAGYYPFPRPIATIFSKLDPRHTPFIVIKARKPKE